ncbi:MAG: hypothetical protein C0190_06160 [Thermodesulfobacterium geofontis]|uniref:HEPN domain-containing protein n=1 Tax=Thermodesulfobacterium geofontis TaxID=1295609 RepID=A0A2N7Q801_9BACT|nr:MAG: hypothetical protein C0190_06160 [Thermodesulfobacterium geofontis]PMP94325.1 MAG: hypothetical protein C0169_06660 [Thermodesulfobacterium geofontis]
MVYYIRSKSYYRYALDLYKDLPNFKKDLSELQKKAQEIFKLGLKAIWALSYVTPPKKPPEFKELWNKTIESLDSNDISKLENIKNIIFSEKSNPEEVIESVKAFLEIVQRVLKPIL